MEDRLSVADAQLVGVTLGEGDCELQGEALGVKETLPEPEPRGEVVGVLDVLRDRLPVMLCETDCVALLKGEEVAHSLVVRVVVSDARSDADAEGEAVAAACREGLATQGEYVLRRVYRPVSLTEMVEVGGVGTAEGVKVAEVVEECDA